MSRQPDVVIRAARNGRGLFAARSYAPGETIIRIFGRIVSADAVWTQGGRFADNSFRFGPETYLDPGDEAGGFLNHSCAPNAGIRKSKNQLFLVASTPIRANAEIVIDYSTILGDDDIWTMRCNCGARACRQTVRGFGTLPSVLKARYIERGLVPAYILKTLVAEV